MKLKRSLFFSLLGLGTIGFVTTAGLVLSSCSSTSNPYAKYTDIVANIGGTSYKFKHNTNSTFGIVEGADNKFTTTQDLYNEIFKIKDSDGKSLVVQPDMMNKYKDQWQGYTSAINKYNNTYIASQVYTYLASFMSYFTQILMKSQPYINPTNVNNFIDITQWSTKQKSTKSKELAFALNYGAGEGYQVYSVWPKTINFDFQVAGGYKTPGGAAYLEDADPNPSSIKVNITKFDVTYSWYKHEQVGGDYINDINVINNALTSSQKSILKNKFGLDKFTSLDYTISLDTTTSPIQFNYNPGISVYEDPSSKVKTRVFTGMGLIGPSWVQKDGKDNKKTWVVDIQEQSPYKILSTSPFQTLKILMEASTFFKNALVNNKNFLPYRAYKLIWAIGYFANNQDKKEIPNDVWSQVTSNEMWFLNENNFRNPQDGTWQNLKSNVNYSAGIEQIYKLFKIML